MEACQKVRTPAPLIFEYCLPVLLNQNLYPAKANIQPDVATHQQRKARFLFLPIKMGSSITLNTEDAKNVLGLDVAVSPVTIFHSLGILSVT